MKVILKACKRCGGDLVHSRTDVQTESVTCLQCGYERDINVGASLPTLLSRRTVDAMAAADRKSRVGSAAA